MLTLSPRITSPVRSLSGLPLAAAIAQLQGFTLSTDGISFILTRGNEPTQMLGRRRLPNNSGWYGYDPTVSGDDMMGIIEGHRINLLCEQTFAPDKVWEASVVVVHNDTPVEIRVRGATALEAAGRCYVEAFGDYKVSLPLSLFTYGKTPS